MASVIGIDPGLTGAMALLTDENLVALIDLPTWDMDGKKCINPREMNLLLWELVHDDECDQPPLIIIEKAQSMPKQAIAV